VQIAIVVDETQRFNFPVRSSLMPENIRNFSTVTASADDQRLVSYQSGPFAHTTFELLRRRVPRLAYTFSSDEVYCCQSDDLHIKPE